MKNRKMPFLLSLFLATVGVCVHWVNAQTLQNIEVVNLQNNTQELRFVFDRLNTEPSHFLLSQQPPRLVVDFVDAKVASNNKTRIFNTGSLKDIVNTQGKGRLRSTINLTNEVEYVIKRQGATVIVSLQPRTAGSHLSESTAVSNWNDAVPSNHLSHTGELRDVEFHRNTSGAGIIELFLPKPEFEVKVARNRNGLDIGLLGHQWSSAQQRRLDVASFATPVRHIEVVNVKGVSRVRVATQSDFEYSAYPSGSKYIIEVKPKKSPQSGVTLGSQGNTSNGSADRDFKGELISLNFQDIEVRAVLQVIADFTGLNIVVSDAVNSNITVRLQNVPWDQALDVILKAKGLDSRRQGNIIYVAPLNDLAAHDSKVPLVSEIVQINYAKAADVAQVLLAGKSSGGGDNAAVSSAGLSSRGSVSVDPRTNNLLVQDTAEQLVVIRELVAVLDQPVRQVQVDARIVIATDRFGRELGIRWGVAGTGQTSNGTNIGVAGTGSGASQIVTEGTLPALGQRLGVDFLTAGPSLGLSILGKDFMVDLELSAMEEAAKGEVISSPRVLTADRQAAFIKQGQEVPFQVKDANTGQTTYEFKEVVLELKVTPQITPDNKVIMDLKIKKDEVEGSGETVTISKRELETQAIVADGETIVLGGVYEQVSRETMNKVPFLSSIPGVGNLFKNKINANSRVELLIFVTPRLVGSASSFNK